MKGLSASISVGALHIPRLGSQTLDVAFSVDLRRSILDRMPKFRLSGAFLCAYVLVSGVLYMQAATKTGGEICFLYKARSLSNMSLLIKK